MKNNSEKGQGVKTEVVWYKLLPAKWAAMAMREPENAKLGERVRRIILALCEQELGADAFADSVIETSTEAMQAASDHARKAAEARWNKTKGVCPSNTRASDGNEDGCPSIAKRGDLRDSGDLSTEERRQDLLTEKTRGDLPTDLPRRHEQPREESGHARKNISSNKKSIGTGSGGDDHENLANLPNESLPSYAVRFCHEEDPDRALRMYQEIMARIRPNSFREELQAFTDEIKVGNEPDSRSEALVARLMKKIAERKKQKTGT